MFFRPQTATLGGMKTPLRYVPQLAIGLFVVAASATALFSEEKLSSDESARRGIALRESLRENSIHQAALSTVAAAEVKSPELRELALEVAERTKTALGPDQEIVEEYTADAQKALLNRGSDVDTNYMEVLGALHAQRAQICETGASNSWDPSIRGMVEADARLIEADLVRMQKVASGRQ